ncbi:hypothetical protein LZ575_01785 [Antarcticibacterium sp. 1MA-6-2]|nr:hypothetical protein LZ575_01785 [Antarcticibacterium sp. 1MA-6-2]
MEKKKPEGFIIPSKHFKNIAPTSPKNLTSEERRVISENEYAKGDSAPTVESQVPAQNNPDPEKADKVPAEGLPDPEKTNCHPDEQPLRSQQKTEESIPHTAAISKEKVSGLSLASIRKKKELLAKQQGKTASSIEEKNEKFTETQLHAAWDDYIHRLKNKGEKILASIMETDMPKVNGNIISIELLKQTL